MTEVCSSAPALPEIPDTMFFHHMVVNKPLKLVYCFVPKAGCTFWKRAFYYIQKTQEHEYMASLFDIKKDEIHRLAIDKLTEVGGDFASKHSFLNEAKKIIIVREPYSRLFSAWVDKLFLPDFWRYIGIPIVKNYRSGAGATALQCGHDVSFHEYLRYVVDIGRATTFTAEQFDDHWLPISRVCQTCHVTYDLVGRMEDFSKSRDTILTSTGMDKYIATNISSMETNIDNIKLNIEAYWLTSQQNPNCISQDDLLTRLWASFQFQGFLPSDLPLPLDVVKADGQPTMGGFLKLVSDSHVRFLKESPRRAKAQRKEAMLRAYRAVPKNLLYKIKDLFHLDFNLYGYDPEPVEIFG